MLSKLTRLDKKTFDSVYGFGTNVSGSLGYFKILPWTNTEEVTRIACVASRKENKKAVDRNMIRRRGYAAIEENKDKLPEKGYGIIWFLPQEAATVDFSKLVNAAENMIISLDKV